MFSGAIVAIVTPFKDGKVDEKAYREADQLSSSRAGVRASCPAAPRANRPR
ncbi:MAG: hypothetical protein MZV70_73145 [Desulfobacterales bacterium]|nr:hypothetical protein [Desulfobacterales bacterium]